MCMLLYICFMYARPDMTLDVVKMQNSNNQPPTLCMYVYIYVYVNVCKYVCMYGSIHSRILTHILTVAQMTTYLIHMPGYMGL